MLSEQHAETEQLYESRVERLEGLMEEWKEKYRALRRRFALETEGFRRDAKELGRQGLFCLSLGPCERRIPESPGRIIASTMGFRWALERKVVRRLVPLEYRGVQPMPSDVRHACVYRVSHIKPRCVVCMSPEVALGPEDMQTAQHTIDHSLTCVCVPVYVSAFV